MYEKGLEQIDSLIRTNILKMLVKEESSAPEIKVAMDYLKARGFQSQSFDSEAMTMGRPRPRKIEDLFDPTTIPVEALGDHPAA